ncbi:hypothetical protein Nepgr_007263 [Nepenthes gracilis]|uniref:TIR domain-containing protein n=1 Tax=Nepenthes gracilis TaxID=150966 RepID=A0AAD3S6Q1_NEPGR|nr:hypothetical protein Nepgr_007263 [Nepenthes gracilis]
MQRSIIAKAITYIPSRNRVHQPVMMGLNQRSCDVFINHRGADTKRTISGLLYNHLYSMGFSPFLDSKNMKPGDNLYDNISKAIKDCKVGVAVFSPRYTESYFCLHELSLMMESKKKVIPVFCDIKPSELLQPMGQYGGFTAAEAEMLSIRNEVTYANLLFIGNQKAFILHG